MNIVEAFSQEQSGERLWIERLDDEDLAFLKRFLLASGTLKELARDYGISYPTVRLRLDRLIQKVRLMDEHRAASELEMQLRVLHAEGRLDERAFRSLLAAHRKEQPDA